MNREIFVKCASIATLVAVLVAAPVDAAPPEGFAARVEELRKAAGVPGMYVDAAGHVAQVTMKAVSPLADFSYDYQDLVFTPGARGTE